MAFIDLRTQQDRRQALLEMGMKNLMSGIQGFEERSAKEDALLRDQEKQDRETAIAFAKEGLVVPAGLMSKKKVEEPGFFERLFNSSDEQQQPQAQVTPQIDLQQPIAQQSSVQGLPQVVPPEAGGTGIFTAQVGGQPPQLPQNDPFAALREKVAARKAQEQEIKDLDLKLKRKKLSEASLSPFQKKLEEARAVSFSKDLDKSVKTEKNLTKIDDALLAQVDYTKRSILGTGPLATGFGARRFIDQDLEKVNAKFKDLSLDKLVTTFAGFSKAIDSDAERAAFDATTASITNDDETNVQILLGMKSAGLKDQAVVEAKAEWVQRNGNLKGFEKNNPILQGLVTTVVSPEGEMKLVNKNEVEQEIANGMLSLDDYVKVLLKGKEPQRPIKTKEDKIRYLRGEL